jgi:uncharacterized protein with von Willebrand factor type A (vWA) domain
MFNSAFNLFNKKKSFHSCLNTDTYDKRSFERLYEMSPKLQEIEAKGEKAFPGFMNLFGDQWASLFKADPQINPEAAGKALNHKPLVQRVMESEEYEKLRSSTQLDDFSSAIGALSMAENTVKYIQARQEKDDKLKEMMEQQKELQKKQRKNQKEMDKQEIQKGKPTKYRENKKKSLEEELQNLQQQMSQQLANNMPPGEMIQEAQQEAQETKDSLENLMSGPQAGSGKGELEKIPLRNQLELAQQLKMMPEIKKVAEWAGRFKAIARKKQKSKTVDSIERGGIKQGDNPELLLPTELSLLRNKVTRLDFYRRFAEKETLQYASYGKEPTGKGPIVLCLDQSSSMEDRKEEAAGFALAVAMIAKSQKRDFAYIPFSNFVGNKLIIPKGKLSPNNIVRIATEFMGGGTDFKSPLKTSVEIIESRERFKNADIIFITDGESNVDNKFMDYYSKKKKSLEFQCQSCVIGRLGPNEEEVLEKFSDEIFSAGNLLETAENSGVFKV